MVVYPPVDIGRETLVKAVSIFYILKRVQV
jgi:hypothetical protein